MAINDEEIVKGNGAKAGVVELDAMSVFLDVTSRRDVTDTIYITRRRPGQGSVRFPIKIRSLEGDRYKQIQEQCTTRTRNRRTNQTTSEFDGLKSQKITIMECVVEPDLKDPKLLSAHGISVHMPEDIVDAVFLPGEKDLISDEILDLSGYNEEVLARAKV